MTRMPASRGAFGIAVPSIRRGGRTESGQKLTNSRGELLVEKSFTGRKRIRKSFGRLVAATPMPNLIEVQKTSYDKFLQMDVVAENRDPSGLQEVFK